MGGDDTLKRRGARGWIAVVVLGLPLCWVLLRVLRVYVQMPIPRDPMIFQYTAWAVRHGQVLYRDIVDVNGPLITLMHVAFQALGGEQASVLRALDVVLHGGVFALCGALLPDAVTQAPTMRQRLVSAVLTPVVLLSVYVSFNYWDSLQRDGLYGLWVLASVALQLHASTRSRRRLWWIAALLSGVAWLGKPTFALFSLAQALGCAWSSRAQQATRARLIASVRFMTGALLGALVTALLSTAIADMPRWLSLLTHDVPDVYRHLAWTAPTTLWRGMRGGSALLGVAGLLVMRTLVWRGQLQPAAWTLALLPLAAIGNVTLQAKPYLYHCEPLWMTVTLQWLAIAHALWLHRDTQRTRVARFARWALTLGLWALCLLSVSTSMYAGLSALLDPRHPAAHDVDLRMTLLSHDDSQLRDEKLMGEHIASITTATDRVQVFGMDPSVLFWARRLTATPYLYAFDLIVDETLKGARAHAASQPALTTIARYGTERRADFLARIQRQPPAAIVFPNSAVFLPGDPETLFRTRMPEAATWLDTHYRLDRVIGSVRVYVRSGSSL